jgi:hypothetical protein
MFVARGVLLQAAAPLASTLPRMPTARLCIMCPRNRMLVVLKVNKCGSQPNQPHQLTRNDTFCRINRSFVTSLGTGDLG